MDVPLHDFEMSDSETELLLNPAVNRHSMAKRDYTSNRNSRIRRRRGGGIRMCFQMLCG